VKILDHGVTQVTTNSPVCRAEYWRFYWEQPEGTSVPSATPNKNARAQEASGIRVAFSLDIFFCGKMLLYFLHSPYPCGLAKQKKVACLRVREPDVVVAIHNKQDIDINNCRVTSVNEIKAQCYANKFWP
jgi:hypothetical protein